jgi:hypothetical protein
LGLPAGDGFFPIVVPTAPRFSVSFPSHQAPPSPEELESLVKLLDDETPEVRQGIAARLAQFGGDVSEWLAERNVRLTGRERGLLSAMLGAARRAELEREWLAPSGGAEAMGEDWEGFEAMLRLISDFLHDGVSIRQPLSDALDLLAEEAAEREVMSAEELRVFLFVQERLKANGDDGDDPRNLDLAWAIATGQSNPLGLGLVFMLVGRRLGFEVEAVDFPGHFLCRIYREGFPIVIDCHDHGRQHLQSTLLESPDLDRGERAVLRQAAHPGRVMRRLLDELESDLEDADRGEDAALIRRLRKTLG